MPVEIVLPSAKPSGDALNDRVIFTFFAAQSKPAPDEPATPVARAPAVILLHYLGAPDNRDFEDAARDLSKRGIAGAVMMLPYHMKRRPQGQSNGGPFYSGKPDLLSQALAQSASDVRTITDWLSARADVDPKRIGIAGISLGAIVTHLAMGQDERLSAGVAFLGGGDIAGIFTTSLPDRIFNRRRAVPPEIAAKLRPVDPLTYADANRPRRVLMVQAARDLVVPTREGEKLWQALGRPPIQWIDTNHFGLRLARGAVKRTATAYFERIWSGQQFDARDLPRIYVPTLKSGFLTGLDSLVTPAIQAQFFSLGKGRNHLSILSANLGLSGRGPFLSVATPVNPFVDVGVARRLGGRKVRPYASVHLAF